MGGQAGINDALLQISTVGSLGEILTFTVQGQHWNGTLNISNQSGTITGHAGNGAKFDLNYNAGAYTSVSPGTGTKT